MSLVKVSSTQWINTDAIVTMTESNETLIVTLSSGDVIRIPERFLEKMGVEENGRETKKVRRRD